MVRILAYAHLDTAKASLEHGADVKARADDGGTALMLAASCCDAGIFGCCLIKVPT